MESCLEMDEEPQGQNSVVPTFQRRQRGKEEPWKQREDGPERAENHEETTAWELREDRDEERGWLSLDLEKCLLSWTVTLRPLDTPF